MNKVISEKLVVRQGVTATSMGIPAPGYLYSLWRLSGVEGILVTVSEISFLWHRKLWILEPFIHLSKNNKTNSLLSNNFMTGAVLVKGTCNMLQDRWWKQIARLLILLCPSELDDWVNSLNLSVSELLILCGKHCQPLGLLAE